MPGQVIAAINYSGKSRSVAVPALKIVGLPPVSGRSSRSVDHVVGRVSISCRKAKVEPLTYHAVVKQLHGVRCEEVYYFRKFFLRKKLRLGCDGPIGTRSLICSVRERPHKKRLILTVGISYEEFHRSDLTL